MRKLSIDYPNYRDVVVAYGSALAASGQFQPALNAVRRAAPRRAAKPEYPYWKLVSVEAAILDPLGQS